MRDRLGPPSNNRTARILLIEADRQLAALLSELLRAHGYEAEARQDYMALDAAATAARFDLVIMAVASTGNGLDVLRRLRRRANLAILVLAAGAGEAHRIELLESGADECLAKPFNPRELLLRAHALLRRTFGTESAGPVTLEVGCVALCVMGHTVRIAEREARLTGAEARLLELLMRRAGRAVPRAELAEHALGRALPACDRSIDTHISSLRAKLGVDGGGETPIKTLRGAGYLFIPVWEPAPVASVEPFAAPGRAREAFETLQ